MTESARDTTPLGDGLEVSPMGFGAMALTGIYGPSSREDGLRALHHAVDVGMSFLDTSDMYGQGGNERLIGEVAAARRSEVTIATKVGIIGDASDGTLRACNDPAHVRTGLEASLSRLGVDEIDLYYLHRREVGIPIEEVVGTMAELVHAGKVRHIGLSEITADELEAAHRVHPIAAVQSEWSVWSRDVERRVVPTAARLGIGFVPYSPLGRGFLTGSLSTPSAFAGDWRSGLSRFRGEAFRQNQAVVTALTSIAHAHEATPAQVALAWLVDRGRVHGLPVVPIPGSRRPERISENVRALEIRLSGSEIRTIDGLSATVLGERSDFPDPDWTSDQRERRA